MADFDVYLLFNLLVTVSSLELQKVLILSRHNIRTPLTANLEKVSPNAWPIWDQEPGFLTAKGARLEEYMGRYIAKWLDRENLIKGCRDVDDIYIYANTRQRTRESAEAFVKGAFSSCIINVHSINSEEADPIFNPVFRNKSKELKNTIIMEMQKHLDGLELKESYEVLERILDLRNASICLNDKICSFNRKDIIIYEIGQEPNIIGPLEQGNLIVDSFLMSYYEGMPLKDVGWGKINNPETWKSLAKITKENQNIRFNSTILAKQVAKPLLNYISNVFKTENSPKFTLLYGHDANLNSVMAAIGFKSFVLPDQYETTPLGGKLIFQKWQDKENNVDLLKVNYVYQTIEQLRKGTKLSDRNPPRWVEMEILECPKDNRGYCLWVDFMKILNSL